MIVRRLVLALALVVLVAVPAGAQTTDQIVDRAVRDGLYVDPGIGAASYTTQLSNQVARAGNAGLRFVVVLLDDDPTGGATTFGDAVLDELSGGGTVLVLSGSQEALVSDVFGEATRARALDEGFEAAGNASGPPGTADLAYVTAVVDVLTGSSGGGDAADADGGGGGFIVLLVVLGVIGLVVFLIVRSQRKNSERRARGHLEEARTEIKTQLDAMANTILEITDEVQLSAPEEDNVHLEAAGRTYTEAMEAYENATDLRDLESIGDRLDEAQWQLAAATAIARGDEPPPKPEPAERASCFFDPTHRGPFEDAEVTTPAGTKTVRVCRRDADLLRKGERAEPRMITVGGQNVPAPRAPRSHGGGGFDLGGALSVLVGGMASGRSYDWGGRSAGRRTGGRSRPSSGSTKRTRGRTGRSRGRRR